MSKLNKFRYLIAVVGLLTTNSSEARLDLAAVAQNLMARISSQNVRLSAEIRAAANLRFMHRLHASDSDARELFAQRIFVGQSKRTQSSLHVAATDLNHDGTAGMIFFEVGKEFPAMAVREAADLHTAHILNRVAINEFAALASKELADAGLNSDDLIHIANQFYMASQPNSLYLHARFALDARSADAAAITRILAHYAN